MKTISGMNKWEYDTRAEYEKMFYPYPTEFNFFTKLYYCWKYIFNCHK